MNIWGNRIKLSIFGESHGKAIGITIDGLPAGIELDFQKINLFLERRKAGKNKYTTSRKEKDEFIILSGYKDGYTTGAPLCTIFENSNTIGKDYDNLKYLLRPGHSDYPAGVKFNGYNDVSGGGHFSGRITLALAFAGAIAIDVLERKNIKIYSHIKKILDIKDKSFLEFSEDDILNKFKNLKEKDLPFIDEKKENEAKELLEKISQMGDSVGGEIECICLNLPTGLGSPFFDSLESKISHLAFSIPAIKGIAFGLGFEFSDILGSKANDLYYLNEKKEIKTETNNNGGILGGLSTGMPLNFAVVVKPTSSISKIQKTVNIKTMKEDSIEIKGRHDSCIVPRVLPVVEAITALAILDEIIS